MPSPINLDINPEGRFSVGLGPKPGMPDWHVQSNPSRYSFPTLEAATRFAQNHSEPGREVVIIHPDGSLFSVPDLTKNRG